MKNYCVRSHSGILPISRAEPLEEKFVEPLEEKFVEPFQTMSFPEDL